MKEFPECSALNNNQPIGFDGVSVFSPFTSVDNEYYIPTDKTGSKTISSVKPQLRGPIHFIKTLSQSTLGYNLLRYQHQTSALRFCGRDTKHYCTSALQNFNSTLLYSEISK